MDIYSDVTFDGFQLNSLSGVDVLSVDSYKPAKRNVQLNSLARSNSSKVSSSFYTSRVINILVSISSTSRGSAESIFDSLLSKIQGEEKVLSLNQSSGTRNFNCTYSDYDLVVGGGSYIECDLHFVCSDSLGYDSTDTTLASVSNHTTFTKTSEFTVDGSAPWQQPKVTVTLSSVTGGTDATVTIGNPDLGQDISVTRTWSSSDILVVDSSEKTVKVNGAEVEFSGAFPEYQKGTRHLYYSDNFTARTVSYTVVYKRRWV